MKRESTRCGTDMQTICDIILEVEVTLLDSVTKGTIEVKGMIQRVQAIRVITVLQNKESIQKEYVPATNIHRK